MNIEEEKKFKIHDASYKKVKNYFLSLTTIAGLQMSNPINKHILDVYFDTLNLDLSREKKSLRLRKTNDLDIKVTFKTPKNENQAEIGKHIRSEFEGVPSVNLLQNIMEISGLKNTEDIVISEFDFNLLGVNGIFQKFGINEVFRLENQRLSRVIKKGSEKICEITLDSVKFFNDYKTGGFHELEIERLGGTDSLFRQISYEIQKEIKNDSKLSSISKYQRSLDFLLTEDYHDVELKFLVDDNSNLTLRKIKQRETIADCLIKGPIEYHQSDVYYDLIDSNRSLIKKNCYLRIRKRDGKADEFTLRKYIVKNDQELIDTKQIKGEANLKKLGEIRDYLIAKKLLSKKTGNINPKLSIRENLTNLGLVKSMNVETDRRIFSLFSTVDQNNIISLKYDDVTFKKGDTEIKCSEIEISAESIVGVNKLKEIGWFLVNSLNAKPIDIPKYLLGLKLIKGKKIKEIESNHFKIYERIPITQNAANKIREEIRNDNYIFSKKSFYYWICGIILIISIILIWFTRFLNNLGAGGNSLIIIKVLVQLGLILTLIGFLNKKNWLTWIGFLIATVLALLKILA